jgi:hypothetical protein
MIEPGAAPAKLPGVGESGSETPAGKGEKWHMTQVWVASLAATHEQGYEDVQGSAEAAVWLPALSDHAVLDARPSTPPGSSPVLQCLAGLEQVTNPRTHTRIPCRRQSIVCFVFSVPSWLAYTRCCRKWRRR